MDDDDLPLTPSSQDIDAVNAGFYGMFPYPQPPHAIEYVDDDDVKRVMLMQDVGDWQHTSMPEHPLVWVAGCGTNQATMTALTFRKGLVVASDVSAASLECAQRQASATGARNLELRQESINEVPYRGEFDYIVCTGVIHHNADPRHTLSKLRDALTPLGMLELMVYNRFSWAARAAFQRAIRFFGDAEAAPDFASGLALARRVLAAFPPKTFSMEIERCRKVSDSVLADALIQPVLHGYTVHSLIELARAAGLRLETYCPNAYDRSAGVLSWELQMNDPELQSRYDALDDDARWQIGNLLTFDARPYLWFYLRRDDCGLPRMDTRTMNDGFMRTVFQKIATTRRLFEADGSDGFHLSPAAIPYPVPATDKAMRTVLEEVDATPIGGVLRRLHLAESFQGVSTWRLRLASSAFPYLRAVPQAS